MTSREPYRFAGRWWWTKSEGSCPPDETPEDLLPSIFASLRQVTLSTSETARDYATREEALADLKAAEESVKCDENAS